MDGLTLVTRDVDIARYTGAIDFQRNPGGVMRGKEIEAGKRWVEERFEELAAELAAVDKVVPGDRWRKLGRGFKTHTHRMAYYVEAHGHVKRGDIAFRDVDLEDAAAGEKAAQQQLETQIRYVLDRFQTRPSSKLHRKNAMEF